MKSRRRFVAVWFVVAFVVAVIPSRLQAQSRIAIAAGTPEDKALVNITNEPDPQKKLAMYQDFVQQFSANPAVVVYGNWQIAQYYQNAGDVQKALDYGDKALAGGPTNLDILVLQTGNAQQLKNNAKVMDYAVRGGEAYNSIAKQAKPEGMSDADFAMRVQQDKDSGKSSYEFLEAAAFNVVVDETNPKTRMADIERFTPAFPDSRFEESVTSYAMVALSELKDNARLVAFGEKTLAANPRSLPALLLLSGAYAEDPKPGSMAKAVGYAQEAIKQSNAGAPDADRNRKVSAGVAHSTLGYVYMKQDKTAASIPELKSATELLKGLDDQQYAIALYRLGFAYAKTSKFTEAREILNEAVRIAGPVQPMAQDLLSKVNAARSKGK
jgi:tetratricopeptide (TPR) repeat protein